MIYYHKHSSGSVRVEVKTIGLHKDNLMRLTTQYKRQKRFLFWKYDEWISYANFVDIELIITSGDFAVKHFKYDHWGCLEIWDNSKFNLRDRCEELIKVHFKNQSLSETIHNLILQKLETI